MYQCFQWRFQVSISRRNSVNEQKQLTATLEMTTKEKSTYYSDTLNREIRDDLIFSVSLIKENKVALDCGCGAGADIAYLRKNGFVVHAFDIEEESIRICKRRFKEDNRVFLSQDSFSSYNYPSSNLVVADSSLFFCPENEFDDVWHRIVDVLEAGGVFCGSFMGPYDTMAGPEYDKDALWPHISVFNEQQVRAKFVDFDILRFTEHKIDGKTPQGIPHQWHIFSVVAKNKQ